MIVGQSIISSLILIIMYAQHWFHSAKLSEDQIRQVAGAFTALQKRKSLARYLLAKPDELEGLTSELMYRSFFAPKEEGGQRLIRTPDGKLADIQRLLNHALQCVYYPLRPECVYGFIIHSRRELDPRNLYTHAQRHLGKTWVLSLDIQDFFSSITTEQVYQVFRGAPFRFSKGAASLLSRLTTVSGLLPTGAPSSPILSNFVALPLDQALLQLAREKDWTFTRFSDDLIFSSDKKFGSKAIETIREAVQAVGFSLHPNKQKLQHRDDPPEITGLVLKGEYPDVSEAYLENIESELKLLQEMIAGKFPSRMSYRLTQQLRQSIQGQINFVGFIRGRQHKSFLTLQYQLAMTMAEAA